MKNLYLDIIEKTLEAYPEEALDQEIARFTKVVAENLKTEHDFHRIAVNIALLNSVGRRMDLYPRMLRMMDLCFEGRIRAADFSVRELAPMLGVLEKSGLVEEERLEKWKAVLAAFDPFEEYRIRTWTMPPEWKCTNIPAFNSAGEAARCGYLGLDATPFIDRQLERLVPSLDENGMFKDKAGYHVYDLVTRSHLCQILASGYAGKYRAEIDEKLKKAGLLTLKMQSVTGEIPFGGRSIQFLHNEGLLCIVSEYEAVRYARLGDMAMAGKFKAVAEKAKRYILRTLEENPTHHNKNYYEDLQIGCEGYAFFNKYMVTLASWCYTAYLFADDSIIPTVAPTDEGGYFAMTSPKFHTAFANAGGYFLEWDLDARDMVLYDANGLGRIHHRDCPSALLLSVPFSAEPRYHQEGKNPRPMSLCGYLELEEFGALCSADVPAKYMLVSYEEHPDRVAVTLDADQKNNFIIRENYVITENGVEITLGAYGEGFFLPVLDFDGKETTAVEETDGSITVRYKGCFARYTFAGETLGYELYYNRNGRYRVYKVKTKAVHIEMGKENADAKG